jgi:hypothetical protein
MGIGEVFGKVLGKVFGKVFSNNLKKLKAVKDNRDFQGLVYSWQQYLKDNTDTRVKKRETFNLLLNQLREEVFQKEEVAIAIIGMINMLEDVCKEYENTDAQVNGIISFLPRMEYWRVKLEEVVKESRQKYNLPI